MCYETKEIFGCKKRMFQWRGKIFSPEKNRILERGSFSWHGGLGHLLADEKSWIQDFSLQCTDTDSHFGKRREENRKIEFADKSSCTRILPAPRLNKNLLAALCSCKIQNPLSADVVSYAASLPLFPPEPSASFEICFLGIFGRNKTKEWQFWKAA